MQVLIIMVVFMGSAVITFSVCMLFSHNFWLTVVPAAIVSVFCLMYFDNKVYKMLNDDKKSIR